MKNDYSSYVVCQMQGQEKSQNIKRMVSLAMVLLNLTAREIVHLHIADFALWLCSNWIAFGLVAHVHSSFATNTQSQVFLLILSVVYVLASYLGLRFQTSSYDIVSADENWKHSKLWWNKLGSS